MFSKYDRENELKFKLNKMLHLSKKWIDSSLNTDTVVVINELRVIIMGFLTLLAFFKRETLKRKLKFIDNDNKLITKERQFFLNKKKNVSKIINYNGVTNHYNFLKLTGIIE